MPNKRDIYAHQIDSDGNNFNESIISGSNLIITTDGQGVLTGSARISSSQVTNDSNVSGSTVTDALNELQTSASAVLSKNVITPSTGSSTEGTLFDWQNLQESIGVIDGGEVTDNGDGTVAVNSGSLFIKSSDDIRGELLISTFPSASSLTINPVDTQVYFYVDYNVGSPIVASSSVTPNGDHTKVLLASVVREAPIELHIANKLKTVGHSGINLLQQRFRDTTDFDRTSGAIPTISSSLYINITAGEWWQGLTEFSTPAYDSFDTQFEYYYQTGSTWKSYFTNQLDNTIYNDTSLGITSSLSPNNYGVHWLYLETDGDVVVILGTANHPNIASAEDELAPATVPAHVSREHARLIARIITKDNDSVFNQVDTTYRQTFEAGTATSHDSLANLQGGQSGEYYHLTQAEHDNIILNSDTASMTVLSASFASTASYVDWPNVDNVPEFVLVSETSSMTVATASVALNVYISQSGQDVNLGNITASAVTASGSANLHTDTKFGSNLGNTHRITGSV
ncbi:MAG: hypothetical protein ACXACA_00900, partial [Candidatus Ranarchaeia archaeon]